MYLNRITLIGFIGSDAERKASNATNIAIFSLATKTSWKNARSPFRLVLADGRDVKWVNRFLDQ